MPDRYFVETPIDSDQARLVGAEAHHLAHVMRAKPGSEVTLFDGSGQEFLARVERVGRSEIELAVLSRAAIDREAPLQVTLGTALPKADRRRWLVEKAVELGAALLVPLQTARSGDCEVSARLRQAVIEASKQCGRNRLMEIGPPTSLEDFLSAAPTDNLRLIAHSAAPAAGMPLAQAAAGQTAGRGVTLAVGPEGGFTPAEFEQALGRGWQAVSLGPRVLRVETAAIALVAALVLPLERE
jgi:16S rRNA (uracil1498-N3)-methyltransferase